MSGFDWDFVGFDVGFLGLPHTDHVSRLSSLRAKCRECRVSAGVESSGEIRGLRGWNLQFRILTPKVMDDALNTFFPAPILSN
jgi:hypothetical protein